MRGIHRWPVNSPRKGQWRGALMFSWICALISGWVYNGAAGDLRRHRAHNDVTVMIASDVTQEDVGQSSSSWPIQNKLCILIGLYCIHTLYVMCFCKGGFYAYPPRLLCIKTFYFSTFTEAFLYFLSLKYTNFRWISTYFVFTVLVF